MKPCPECGREMQPGRLAVRPAFWGMVFAGHSHMNCSFWPEGGGEQVLVIPSDGDRHAYRCDGCATVLIADPERTPLGWENMRSYNRPRASTPPGPDGAEG